MHLHLGHRWFGSDGVLAALKTQISKCWLSDLPFIFLPLISTEPIWPSSVAVFVLAVFRCGVHIVSSTSGSSFKSEKSNYILLKDGENMPFFQIYTLYRKIRSSDNLWPREQAMIGVTSNQGNGNTSVSEESRACFQFGGGAFVGSWVWGRKTASHISGEIMRPIRLQHRRGTKIAAIKKVKRESRGSEEGGAVLWKLPWTCLFSLSLSRLNPFFTEQGKTCRRRCHFFLSLLLRNVQYSWNPNKTFTCFVFFCQRQKKNPKRQILGCDSAARSFSDNWGYWRWEMLTLASVAASYPCGAKNSSSCSHLTSLCHPSPVFKMWRRGYKQQQQSSAAPSEPKQEAQ